jgi:hypothetical protein
MYYSSRFYFSSPVTPESNSLEGLKDFLKAINPFSKEGQQAQKFVRETGIKVVPKVITGDFSTAANIIAADAEKLKAQQQAQQQAQQGIPAAFNETLHASTMTHQGKTILFVTGSLTVLLLTLAGLKAAKVI